MSNYLLNSIEGQLDARKDKAVLDRMVTSNQGGLVFKAPRLNRLRRFLILGAEGGTFYASEQKLVKQNLKSLNKALEEDYRATIDLIVEVSQDGLAPSNSPALFALAVASSFTSKDQALQADVRSYALANLKKVARTGTHLFEFISYVNELRGWGSALRKAVSQWYLDRSPLSLAQQVTKYGQRDGWSHRDVLRLAHTNAEGTPHNLVLGYAVNGVLGEGDDYSREYLEAVLQAKACTSVSDAVALIQKYNLPREVLNTELLQKPEIWDALLRQGKGMPPHALLRNLGNLGKHQLLDLGADSTRYVQERLSDFTALRDARIHPIDVLKAKFVYQSGAGFRGGNTWKVNQRIVDALEETFYGSFKIVEPTGKTAIFGLDVSGSMTAGNVAGIEGFTPLMAEACMVMVQARVETDYATFGFDHRLREIPISSKDTLEQAIKKIYNGSFGGTNHALLFEEARNRGLKADFFAVYTDNETGRFAGSSTPKAIRNYREFARNPEVKVITVGMTAGPFTIADPEDPNMLDVVGFDSSTPRVLSEYVRGTL